MSDRKKQIAGVLTRESAKLPLVVKEEKFLQWGDDHFKLMLGMNPKNEIMLSFSYADVDGFNYSYSPGEESYATLLEIFGQPLSVTPSSANKTAYLKKVMAVLVFYHSEMKRVKDL